MSDGYPGGNDKRQEQRQPVLRAARVRFGGSVIDCLILDTSDGGLRVSSETFVAFPQAVLIEFRSGAQWNAELRWQRGTETGFELTGIAGLSPEAKRDAATLERGLRGSGAWELLGELETARFFGHPEIEAGVGDVRAALTALTDSLRRAAGG